MELQGIKPGKKDYIYLVFSLLFTVAVFIIVAKDKRVTFCDEAY